MFRCILLVWVSTFAGVAGFDASRASAQTFTYDEFGGCEDVVLFAWNQAKTEALLVHADRKALALGVGTSTISLGNTPKGLQVRLELFAEPQSAAEYCTDIGAHRPGKPSATMAAFSGVMTITLGERGVVKDPKPFRTALPFMYQATVVLRDLSFKKPDGSILTVTGPLTLSAAVGHYWG